MRHCYDYPRPAVTVDVALFTLDRAALKVLLIQRGREPFAGRWALPGGFIDQHEDLPDAARRELLEETGLEVGKLLELGAFGTPGRDPRGHTVSVVYLALTLDTPTPAAADDAADVRWFSPQRPPALAFDHADMLRAARTRLRVLAGDPARLSRQLLPRRPSPARLQTLLQATGNRRAADALRQRDGR